MAEEPSSNYYDRLGLNPSVSGQQIRRAYRELSKLYHPDTTELPSAIATAKFQELNEAYATLSNPERRVAYDFKIGYSRLSVIQPPDNLNRPVSSSSKYRSSAYLEPSDRPLSAGEVFALFILGVTFVGCLILVIAIGFTRGYAFQPLTASGVRSTEPVEILESPAIEEPHQEEPHQVALPFPSMPSFVPDSPASPPLTEPNPDLELEKLE